MSASAYASLTARSSGMSRWAEGEEEKSSSSLQQSASTTPRRSKRATHSTAPHTAARSPHSLSSTMPAPLRSALAASSSEVIRTSADADADRRGAGFGSQTASYSTPALMDFDDDDDGIERSNAVMMWGRTSGATRDVTSAGALATGVRVLTRSSQAVARRHDVQPSLAAPLAAFEQRVMTLPMVRDASFSEVSPSASSAPPTRSPRRSQLASSVQADGDAYASPRTLAPPLAATQFRRRLLAHHAQDFLSTSLASAVDEVGALRLELDVLARARDATARAAAAAGAAGGGDSGDHALYTENSRLRALVDELVLRSDARGLALAKVERSKDEDALALVRAKTELTQLRLSKSQLEQAQADSVFAQESLQASLAHSESRRADVAQQCESTKASLNALRAEHDECVVSQANALTAARDAEVALASSRAKVDCLVGERDDLSSRAATLEGKQLATQSQIESMRGEISELKAGRLEAASQAAFMREQVSQAQIQLVHAEGSAGRLERELAASKAHIVKLSEELARVWALQSDSVAQTALANAKYRMLAEENVAHLRTQLAEAKAAQVAQAEQQLHTIEVIQAEIKTLSVDHAAVKSDNVVLRHQNATLEEKAVQLRASLVTLTFSAKKLNEELRESKRQEDDAKEALEEAQVQLVAERMAANEKAATSPPPTPARKRTASPQVDSSALIAAAASAEVRARSAEAEADSLLQKIRELEVKIKEQTLSSESVRRAHERCAGRISKAESDAEREVSLRRVQLKSAKEVRRRLEGHCSVLDVRCQALAKALAAAGIKAGKDLAPPPPLSLPSDTDG